MYDNELTVCKVEIQIGRFLIFKLHPNSGWYERATTDTALVRNLIRNSPYLTLLAQYLRVYVNRLEPSTPGFQNQSTASRIISYVYYYCILWIILLYRRSGVLKSNHNTVIC